MIIPLGFFVEKEKKNEEREREKKKGARELGGLACCIVTGGRLQTKRHLYSAFAFCIKLRVAPSLSLFLFILSSLLPPVSRDSLHSCWR
jgi:hypothetical protein